MNKAMYVATVSLLLIACSLRAYNLGYDQGKSGAFNAELALRMEYDEKILAEIRKRRDVERELEALKVKKD